MGKRIRFDVREYRRDFYTIDYTEQDFNQLKECYKMDDSVTFEQVCRVMTNPDEDYEVEVQFNERRANVSLYELIMDELWDLTWDSSPYDGDSYETESEISIETFDEPQE